VLTLMHRIITGWCFMTNIFLYNRSEIKLAVPLLRQQEVSYRQQIARKLRT